MGLQIAQQHAQLVRHDVREERQHSMDLGGVLDRQRGRHCAAVHTKRAKHLQIELKARASRRIGARDGERDADRSHDGRC